MFSRTETNRERVLLRLIADQQQTIDALVDRLMELSGHPQKPPEFEAVAYEEPPEYSSALEGLPPGYETGEEEEA